MYLMHMWKVYLMWCYWLLMLLQEAALQQQRRVLEQFCRSMLINWIFRHFIWIKVYLLIIYLMILLPITHWCAVELFFFFSQSCSSFFKHPFLIFCSENTSKKLSLHPKKALYLQFWNYIIEKNATILTLRATTIYLIWKRLCINKLNAIIY